MEPYKYVFCVPSGIHLLYLIYVFHALTVAAQTFHQILIFGRLIYVPNSGWHNSGMTLHRVRILSIQQDMRDKSRRRTPTPPYAQRDTERRFVSPIAG
jgi:hypothetical protein